MLKTYYFSDDWSQEEKIQLTKKTVYYMEKTDLPEDVIKPEHLVYDQEGCCVGYTFREPAFPYITMKELFQTERMEQYHVDGHLLLSLASKVLNILENLSEKKIYAGFIDLSFLLVHKEKPDKMVLLSNPEYFQAGNLPSSYPWYPSDARLFEEDFEFFDERSQKKADAKLIYKILTAASKGNAKIPPSQKHQEFSWLFWNILSKEWKDYFSDLAGKEVEYKELSHMLNESLREEKSHMNPMEKGLKEQSDERQQKAKKEKAYALITVLRQAGKSAHDVSRELYLLQEKLELHPTFDFSQGFVLGNKHPFTREFRHYPKEYRSQLPHVISEYSFGEALIVAAEMMEAALKKEERPSMLFILLDGEIKNDKLFQIALKKLVKLKDSCYTKLMLVPAGGLKGEGYQALCNLCIKEKQE